MFERSSRSRSLAAGTPRRSRWRHLAGLLALSLALGGCATTDRLPPVPLSLASSAIPLDIPNARFYADTDAAQIAGVARQT